MVAVCWMVAVGGGDRATGQQSRPTIAVTCANVTNRCDVSVKGHVWDAGKQEWITIQPDKFFADDGVCHRPVSGSGQAQM
jgi:hypothetical protein